MRIDVRKCAAALLICTCAALPAGCNSQIETAATETVSVQYESPALRYKSRRETIRAGEKAQLNDIAHGSNDEEIVRMAQEQLIGICLRDEQESTCEAILEMRGFKDPVVTVHSDSVNVILNADTLTAQESAVILELIVRETGAAIENVKIIPINSSNRIALSQGI